jgi:hypothetical protein
MAGFDTFGVPLPTWSAVIGGCEMLLGVLCLVVTSTAFFLFIFLWKLGSELLYVPAQAYGAQTPPRPPLHPCALKVTFS